MTSARLLLPVAITFVLAACSPATPPEAAPADSATPVETAVADAPPTAKGKTMQEVLDAAAPSDWRPLDPQNTLYMDVGGGRVVIELAPAFAPEHVANIRTLAREKYFDGLAIVRSQDNYVVQWGDPHGGDPAKARPLGSAKLPLPAEFTRPAQGLDFTRLPDADGYAPEVGFVQGFPAGRDPATDEAWLAHCYGTVGAGRGMAPDSSNGAELYVAIGPSRQLDRLMTTVGRVVKGMEYLSAHPRGTGPLGFYENETQLVPIQAVTLAADLPEAQRERLEILRTDTPTWEALVESRRNRPEEFFLRQAGYIELCFVPVPVREIPATP